MELETTNGINEVYMTKNRQTAWLRRRAWQEMGFGYGWLFFGGGFSFAWLDRFQFRYVGRWTEMKCMAGGFVDTC